MNPNNESEPLLQRVAHAPELREYDETVRGPARRTLLKGALGAVGIAVMDQIVGDYLWGGTNPEVVNSSSENADAFPHTAWLIVPGFDVIHPDSIATALQPTMANYGQIATVHYSSLGLQIPDLVRTTGSYCKRRGIRTLHMYGHSMGGMVSVELAAALKQDYGIETDLIVLDCSPNHFNDVKGDWQRIGVRLLADADRLKFHGGPLTRFVLESITAFTSHHGNHDALDITSQSLNKAANAPTSNMLVQSQASYILQYDAKRFVKHIKGTQISHLGPQFPHRDPTVNDTTALRHWIRDFNDRQVHCMTSPDTGHADPSTYPTAYNHMLESVATMSSLPTADDMRRANQASLRGPR